MARENRDDDESERLSVDSVLELLGHYQRREIIRYCQETSQDRVAMQDLVRHLMDVEEDRTGEVPESDHLYSVLVHSHGPKLAAVDVVEYDIEDQYVEYRPYPQIETALSHLDSMEADW